MLFLILSLIYCLIVLSFFFGIFFLKKGENKEFNKFSIIIAASNEEKYLPGLLEKLVNQDYPKENYEIIIADDRSTDKTPLITKEYSQRFPNLKAVRIDEESGKLIGKKNALLAAIKNSVNEILVFTDADCIPTKNWLSEINKYFDNTIDFVTGYSPLISNKRKLNYLKNLERAAHFAVVAGSLGLNWKITCAARNMAYRKSLFEKVNGFTGIGHHRSGDDDLMLQKMAKHIRKTNFMFSQDAIVPSYDKDNLQDMAHLETRRASKWFHYPLPVKMMTLFFLIYYLTFCYSFFSFVSGYLNTNFFFIIFLLKIIPELLLTFLFLLKTKRIKLMLVFPLLELIYIPYYIIFGFKGTFGKYRWKN